MLTKWYDSDSDSMYYYTYYVAMSEAKVDYVYMPSLTYNDNYDWILYRGEKFVKVCSGDNYSVKGLLNLGKTYEEE